MPIYAIGDIQGCYDDLRRLLDKIRFDTASDILWFSGDLVNRGHQSLEVLRFVKALGERAVTVLGNHDLHMLAVAEGVEKRKRHDTFDDVLKAPDRLELLHWLRQQPLLHYDKALDVALVHAGLVPQWDLRTARACAAEVEAMLRGDKYHQFFENMYGDKPARWSDALSGWKRLRFITNTFTRLRYCDATGRKFLSYKGPVGRQPKGYLPWFDVPERKWKGVRILFGHWAALGAGEQGDCVYSLDGGCAWGGALTALRIDSEYRFVSTPCKAVAQIR